ncbi:MAG: TIGR02206 family membrane protein [Actinomycetota bacterium]|nr:TIGR02206 family membrane protein [Actinomycetota bacterium]
MAYLVSVGVGGASVVALCVAARRRPGRWTVLVSWAVGAALAADAASYLVHEAVRGSFSPRTSLPLALCNAAVVVAAVACFWPRPTLVEVTYFWGCAGTVQGLATPDLSARFPSLVFAQYVVGHLGVVAAALLLVVGRRITPRRGAAARTFGITAAYSALVGLVDALSGANYMFLRRPPGEWTLLRVLGPWPWYVVSAAGVAALLFALLDLPFRSARRGGSDGRDRASGAAERRGASRRDGGRDEMTRSVP